MSVGLLVRLSVCGSIGPSVRLSVTLNFFFLLIVSRARDLWRSALLKEDDIQMADDRLTGIVRPVRTFSLVFETHTNFKNRLTHAGVMIMNSQNWV